MVGMKRNGQISLAHFCIEVFLLALAVGLVCQSAVLWRDPWAHEFVISPLLYGAFASFGLALVRLRDWMFTEEPPVADSR